MAMRQYVVWLPAVVALCCCSGCGDKAVDVSGKVTYNGAVVDKPGGKVVFVSDSGKQTPADIGPDGQYLATGVPVGHNRVVAYYANPSLPVGKKWGKQGETPSSEPPPPVWLTPAHYADKDKSGLAVEVESGIIYNINMVGPELP